MRKLTVEKQVIKNFTVWTPKPGGKKKKNKKELIESKNHILGPIFPPFSQTSQAKGKMWVFTWNFQSFATVLNINITWNTDVFWGVMKMSVKVQKDHAYD